MFQYTRLWVAALIIGGVVLLGFVLSVPRAREVPAPSESPTAQAPAEVTLHDAYTKGTHTLTGSVTVPNACTTLAADATFDTSSDVPRILLTLSAPSDDQVCLQVPTKQAYSVSVTAPSDAVIVVTMNGLSATTTSS